LSEIQTSDAIIKSTRDYGMRYALILFLLKRQIVLNGYMFETYYNYLSFDTSFIILLQLQRYKTMRQNNRGIIQM